MNFVFKEIEPSYPFLPQVIALSIGNATKEKICRILESYQVNDQHIIGCFFNQELVAIIGIEKNNNKANIRHISVSKNF